METFLRLCVIAASTAFGEMVHFSTLSAILSAGGTIGVVRPISSTVSTERFVSLIRAIYLLQMEI